MKTIICPNCGTEYDAEEEYCINCGNPTPKRRSSGSYSSGGRHGSSRRKSFPIIPVIVVAVIAIALAAFFLYIKPSGSYKKASALMAQGSYPEAAEAFDALGSFKDSAELADYCREQQQAIIAATELAEMEEQYKDACTLMAAEDYEDALEIFESISAYDGAAEQAEKCRTAITEANYNEAVALFEANNLSGAYDLFGSIDSGYLDTADYLNTIEQLLALSADLNNASVGDTVTFGSIEQDGDPDNGTEPIEWYVIARDDGTVRLLSKYIISCGIYDEEYKATTWEKCDLREIYNGSFMDSMFSDSEKQLLELTAVTADGNANYKKADQGNDTEDYVFALSTKEAEELESAGHSDLLATTATEYVKSFGSGVYKSTYTKTDYTVVVPSTTTGTIGNIAVNNPRVETVTNVVDYTNCWWLRTVSNPARNATYVNSKGAINYQGIGVGLDGMGYRPAITVKLFE